MSGIYGNGIAMNEKVLDLLWGRQSLVLNNIANVDTPGFKTQYLTFEDELRQRISGVGEGADGSKRVAQAVDSTRAAVQTTWTESNRLDGNNVDMDQEQISLVRAAIEYQHVASSITNDINRLRKASQAF